MKRCVVTIAVGKIYYLKLAENLLRSFLLWNQNNDIHFLLITDNTDFFTAYKDLPKVHLKLISLEEGDKSFTSKFKMFEHIIADENIFIDCDCLIYKDFDNVFNAFKGKNFSAIGNNISTGHFFCDVETMMKKFNMPAMPKFVGCIYYFKNNSIAKSIFQKASELKNEYDALGFVRLAGKENEEPLIAVAMAINNEELLANDGTIKADMMYYEKVNSNVLRGYAFAKDPILEITGCETIPKEAHPAVLHFNAVFSDHFHYQKEVFRLDHASYNNNLLSFLVWSLFNTPHNSKLFIKGTLRPLYRYFWGYRDVKKGNR